MLNLSKDKIGGLVFLLFSVLYGYYARQIPLMPGDISQAFNAQTLPNILAITGALLSIILLVTSNNETNNGIDFSAYEFSLVFKLFALVVAFAITLEWLGFLISTILFLVSGFWILGEKNLKRMLIIAFSFSVICWFILSKLLSVYLSSGKVFTILFGS